MIARSTALVVCAACLLLGPAAHADDQSAHCTVRIIHAIESKDGKREQKFDPKIVRLRPYLSRPPFTSWHEFVMLDEKSFDIDQKTPQTFVLPNGKQATVTYVAHLQPSQTGKHRVRLQLQLGDPKKPSLNTVFVVDEGGFVIQVGQRYQQGLLILGTSCEEAHPH